MRATYQSLLKHCKISFYSNFHNTFWEQQLLLKKPSCYSSKKQNIEIAEIKLRRTTLKQVNIPYNLMFIQEYYGPVFILELVSCKD